MCYNAFRTPRTGQPSGLATPMQTPFRPTSRLLCADRAYMSALLCLAASEQRKTMRRHERRCCSQRSCALAHGGGLLDLRRNDGARARVSAAGVNGDTRSAMARRHISYFAARAAAALSGSCRPHRVCVNNAHRDRRPSPYCRFSTSTTPVTTYPTAARAH